MSILVTGGAGFIGSHISRKLVQKGEEVVCVDNLSTGTLDNVAQIGDVRLVKCDIRDKEKLESTFAEVKPKTVYHFASVVGVKRTIENPKEVLDVIIQGTENVLECALKHGCEKVINISSSEVYGNSVEVPEREDSPKNMELPYAVGKFVGEKYADIYYRKRGLKTCSLRLFNVYGPRQDSSDYGFVVGIFIKSALKGVPPTVFGDGFQTRDFNFIEDCVNAIIMAGESEATNGEVLNIAAGKPITILDLAELIIELCGKKLEPVFVPAREFEVRHRFADISKMRRILGYKPRYELREGLRKTIEWYQQNPRR